MKKILAILAGTLLLASLAQAALDEQLLGVWKHVDEEQNPAIISTLTFKNDGTVIFEPQNEPADQERIETWKWETDGKILHFSGVKFLSGNEAAFDLEYRIEGERLFLTSEDGLEESTLTRVKKCDTRR
jgi:hypothetical protein